MPTLSSRAKLLVLVTFCAIHWQHLSKLDEFVDLSETPLDISTGATQETAGNAHLLHTISVCGNRDPWKFEMSCFNSVGEKSYCKDVHCELANLHTGTVFWLPFQSHPHLANVGDWFFR